MSNETLAEKILALHRPSDPPEGFGPHCLGCWEAGGEDGAPAYPCPTVQIVNAHSDTVWAEVGENFGRANPYGSCNAYIGSQVCGFPRRSDGTCTYGHPAQPGWVRP